MVWPYIGLMFSPCNCINCRAFSSTSSASIMIMIPFRTPPPPVINDRSLIYYSSFSFQWDPMITTLPGLYINTVAILKPINWFLDVSMSVACSTFYLRAINVGFATANSILFLLLTRRIYLSAKVIQHSLI